MARSRGHGWWPYWIPFWAFLLLVEIGARLPDSAQGAWLLVKVTVPGASCAYFALRGAYPELRGYPGGISGAALDVAMGLLGALVWVLPFVLVPSLRPDEGGFDPEVLGASATGLALTLRFVGYAMVTPFVEELFMRSWLLRFLDAYLFGREGPRRDFRDVPIGRFSWRAFAVISVFFIVSHQPWEYGVMALWTVGSMLWLRHRRHLFPLVVLHAVTNGAILAFAMLAEGALHDASGAPVSFWFFI